MAAAPRIVALTLVLARLPLRRVVRHAGGAYRYSENIFARCQLSDGTEGWGEGVPRARLLGASAAELWDYFWTLPLEDRLPRSCASWEEVFSLCENLVFPRPTRPWPPGFDHPVRCALELAILDAFARSWGQSLADALQAFPPAKELLSQRSAVQYSATITAADPLTEAVRALFIRWWGFGQCKLKVGLGSDMRREVRRLRQIRRLLGPKIDLRVDANGAWRIEDLLTFADALKRLNITCIEDPVSSEQLPRLRQLRPQLGIPIMLDETIVTKHDLQQAAQNGYCDLVNIRLSKCGGLLQSIRLAAYAQSSGLGFQLGCHPGESGVLSAAGRHFATLIGQIRYLEGSYDRFLFRRLITREDLTFGRGGWAPALQGPGLGVTVDRRRLAPFILRQQTITFF